jgi:sugar (pentulose or hexulose) kinase
MKLPAILIFDVGKTNKKVLLFDEHYKLLQEENIQLNEITDEDGFPCEDVGRVDKMGAAKIFLRSYCEKMPM